MELSVLSLIFSFSLPVLLVVLVFRLSKPKLRLPPGPRPLPIIGNLHHMGALPFRTFHKLSKTHGHLMYLRLGQVPYLVVSSPSLAEQVLKTQDLSCCSRPILSVLEEYTYNGRNVAIAPYGDHWRKLRKVFTIELVGAKNVPAFRRVREEEISGMVEFISTQCDSGSPVNITELAFRYTGNVINRVAFGHDEAHGKYGEKHQFQEALVEFEDLLGMFWVEDFYPGFGWIDGFRGLRKRLKTSANELDKFYEEVIDKHMKSKKIKEAIEEDIIDGLIRLSKEDKDLTMDNIKGCLLDILSGGNDTISATVIWTMAELTRNPNIMKEAQSELREIIGTKGIVEEADLPKLNIIKSLVSETLRLHPPIPLLIPHETIRQTKIDGYDIPDKTVVFVNVWAIGRDENYWENPLEYNPRRFNEKEINYKGNHFEFLPFGSGRRMCPGLNFGATSTELVLANLLYKFDWKLPEGMSMEDVDMTEAPGITANKKTDMILVAKDWVAK